MGMEVREFVKARKEVLRAEASSFSRPPCLAIVQVGHVPASDAYIRGKRKDAEEIGFSSRLIPFGEEVSENELILALQSLSQEESVDGIIVQLPLPKGISPRKVQEAVAPRKDVDGFGPLSPYDPCTPKGILMYLDANDFAFEGRNAVVLGRSDIVGKPMARLLTARNMNVTLLHSRTSLEDERFYIAHADLVVASIGKAGFLDERFAFKRTAWLVDVGINRGEDGHLHGDILPGREVALQTPVPGGVGLLTRLALMENLFEAAKRR